MMDDYRPDGPFDDGQPAARFVQLTPISKRDELTGHDRVTLTALDDAGRVWVYRHPGEVGVERAGWVRMVGDDVRLELGDHGWK